MGAVRSNRHGRLYIDFTFGGKRRREGTGLEDTPANRSKVKKHLAAIEAEIGADVFDYLRHFPHGNDVAEFEGRPEDMPTFKELAELWLAENEKHGFKPSTLRNYRLAIEAYAYPLFGDRPVESITEGDVARLAGKIKSASSYNYTLTRVKTVFNLAVRRKFIKENPAEYIRRAQEEETDIDPFSLEEVGKLLSNAGDVQIKNWIAVAVWTGMRPNEQASLRWPAVDLTGGMIHVRVGRSGGIEGTTKTGKGRWVDMLPPVVEALMAQKELKLQGDYVFQGPDGQAFNPDSFRRHEWPDILKDAKLRYRPPYQLKHSFISNCLLAGEDISWISKQVGTSVKTILKHYARFIKHRTRSDGAAVMNALSTVDKTEGN